MSRNKVMPLTKVDVSRRPITDPGVVWLVANGYRFKVEGDFVFLVRPV